MIFHGIFALAILGLIIFVSPLADNFTGGGGAGLFKNQAAQVAGASEVAENSSESQFFNNLLLLIHNLRIDLNKIKSVLGIDSGGEFGPSEGGSQGGLVCSRSGNAEYCGCWVVCFSSEDGKRELFSNKVVPPEQMSEDLYKKNQENFKTPAPTDVFCIYNPYYFFLTFFAPLSRFKLI
ncbi:MAG TPA: hypothetical protein VJB92_03810 [Candidatus Paceibacterota bacterium]